MLTAYLQQPTERTILVFHAHSIIVHHHPTGVAYYTPRQRFPLIRLALRSVRVARRHGEDYCPTPAELGLRWRAPEN